MSPPIGASKTYGTEIERRTRPVLSGVKPNCVGNETIAVIMLTGNLDHSLGGLIFVAFACGQPTSHIKLYRPQACTLAQVTITKHAST